jgi:flagellar FliL protein
MSKTETVDEAPASAKGGKKKLLSALVVLVAATGAAAWFFLFSGGSAEAEEPHPGETVVLEPIAVNLAGGGFLKIGVMLQLTEDAAELSDPTGSKALDLVISQFSQAERVDVTGARDALKAALEQKIIEANEGDVMGIYYSEYVTQ